MKRDIINANFLSALNIKVPNRTKLANLLVQILQIEKEAVYRRLRGEVPFTFAEVSLTAEKLGISLDNIIGIESSKDRPFVLKLTDYDEPQNVDYIMWENYIEVLQIIHRVPGSSISETYNILPFPLCYKYLSITTFYIFKWRFQAKSHLPLVPFEQIKLTPQLKVLQNENLKESMNFDSTTFIFDPFIFTNIVNDIKYFYNIKLINKENVEKLKKELLDFTAYLEHIAIIGEYDETKKKVSIYISGIAIDSNYTYIEATNFFLMNIKTLALNGASTTDEITYETTKGWINALKRVSTLISVSGEKQRIEFFNKQREIIDLL